MGNSPKAPSGYPSPSPVLGDSLSFIPAVKYNLLINHSARITVTNKKTEQLKQYCHESYFFHLWSICFWNCGWPQVTETEGMKPQVELRGQYRYISAKRWSDRLQMTKPGGARAREGSCSSRPSSPLGHVEGLLVMIKEDGLRRHPDSLGGFHPSGLNSPCENRSQLKTNKQKQ